MAVRYYTITQDYCLNKLDLKEVEDKFKEVFDIDIRAEAEAF